MSKAQKGDEFGSSVEVYREADGTGILLISSPKAANEHGVVHRFEQHRLDGGNVQTTWSSQIQGPVPLPGAAGSHFEVHRTEDAARGLALIGASQMTELQGKIWWGSAGTHRTMGEPIIVVCTSKVPGRGPARALSVGHRQRGRRPRWWQRCLEHGWCCHHRRRESSASKFWRPDDGWRVHIPLVSPTKPATSKLAPTDSSNASAISQPQVIDVAIPVTLAIAGLAVLLTILMALFASRRILKSGAIGRRYRFLKRRLPTGAQRAVRMISSSRPGTTLTVFTPEVAAKTPQAAQQSPKRSWSISTAAFHTIMGTQLPHG